MCLRRLTYRKKVVIAQQVASALAHVHQKGVVHNDIKLDNVLFSLDGSAVKLVDFGNADWAGTKQTDWRYVPQPRLLAPCLADLYADPDQDGVQIVLPSVIAHWISNPNYTNRRNFLISYSPIKLPPKKTKVRIFPSCGKPQLPRCGEK